MQHEVADRTEFWTPKARSRFLLGFIVVLVLILLAVLPPYISVSRYQRRIAAGISASLGRQVHFDNITLHLLPLPGLTIENFVVNDSPDFGYEPVMRANTVEARLRIASLWRRRIEVSRISLDAPSINLVRRREDGRWNLQGILMQASQIDSAPTAQARAGDAPRFPYIEATDARVNIKDGTSKLPFSLKEAEFALWLPQPDEWHLRLAGKPVRTDTDVSDVGLLRVDAVLGRATDLNAAPIDLSASWKPTPLGEASKLTVGYDTGWRGEASGEATLKGKLGQAKLTTDLHLLALRRADFVPENTAEIDAHCEAVTSGLLRSLMDVRCVVPTASDKSVMAAFQHLRSAGNAAEAPTDAPQPGVLTLRGDIPNIFDWPSASLSAQLQDASATYALAWLRLFSRRIPASGLGGVVSGSANKEEGAAAWTGTLACLCILPPTVPVEGTAPTRQVVYATLTHNAEKDLSGSVANVAGDAPLTLPLDQGEIDTPETGTTLATVAGSGNTVTVATTAAQARAMAAVIPPLADGLDPDASGPMQAHRTLGGPQTWSAVALTGSQPETRHRRRR